MTARKHPPDRRTPIPVPRGQCPAGRLCGCCPGPAGQGHFIPGENGKPGKQITNCRMTHPPHDRQCRPPYPNNIPPCPERNCLPQNPPTAPAGRCCTECGRLTARVYLGDALPWAKGTALPWCAGDLPAHA